HPLQLALAHCLGIADHAALGATERDIDHSALPGHPTGKGAHFVQGDIGRVAYAALGRATGDVVLHPEAGEYFDVAVIHGYWKVNDDFARGVLSNFHKPSSKLSLRAAKSNRALCASQGLISWSKVSTGLPVDISFSNSDSRPSVKEFPQDLLLTSLPEQGLSR